MASWKVTLRHGSISTDIGLRDVVGPINRFAFDDSKAFTPTDGDFTNQTRQIVPTLPNTWVLHDFDIDAVSVGEKGNGEAFDSGGTFPIGPLTWEVTGKL